MPGLVVCFSYLAAAELWQVPRFPSANHGAEVLSVERSIAADAPMAAAVLAQGSGVIRECPISGYSRPWRRRVSAEVVWSRRPSGTCR
jgi:hypothetical protein